MGQLRVTIATILAAATSACAALPTEPIPEANVEHGVAVQGYGPVAYFTEGRPVPGSEQFAYRWRGAEFLFASASDLAQFEADPGAHALRYGGYRAFAIALGRIADSDPQDWAVVDGKLYLNNSALAQSLWVLDKRENIEAGDRNWTWVPKMAQP